MLSWILSVTWASPLDTVHAELQAGRYGAVVAVVVERGGEVLHHEQYAPGAHRRDHRGADERLHDIRSAGKSITALAVGAALADGHLASVDAEVSPLLGVDSAGLAGVTVRDLLTMSSSLDCDDWAGRRSPGFEERMYRRRSWTDFVVSLPRRPGWQRDAEGLGPFSYCTAGAFLLGQVLEATVGEAADAYIQRRLLDPLGIHGVAWRRSRIGEIQTGGQLMIEAIDLARIVRMVLDGGVWQGERVLPAEWVAQVWTPWRSLGKRSSYGYLWWNLVVHGPQGDTSLWYMLGNGGNLAVAVPELDLVVVVQAANFNQPTAHDDSLRLLGAVVSALPDTSITP